MSTVNRNRDSTMSDLQAELRLQAARSVMFHSAVAGRLGLAVTDFNCLNVLSLDGPQTPGRLAERIGITRGGAVTAMIDRLENAGFVRRRRDTEDRRRVMVELIEETAGQSIPPLFAGLAAPLAQLLEGYGNDELQFLLGFTHRLNDLVLNATTSLRDGPRHI